LIHSSEAEEAEEEAEEEREVEGEEEATGSVCGIP